MGWPFRNYPERMDLLGFWSYVHADDDVDQGRISELARDVVGNYEAVKAEALQLFLDRDDLKWGDQWKDKIDDALSNVAFFIPVLTPRYFKSVECRRELQFFIKKAETLGIGELILPILYIDVPELHETDPTDQLIVALQRIQWTPWMKYRFCNRDEGAYRSAVYELASELVRRVDEVERTDIVAAAASAEDEGLDESEHGTLDRLAAMELAMPRWTKTLSAIGEEIEEIGRIMVAGTDDIKVGEKSGRGYASRLTVARRVANELESPVGKIEHHGQEFAHDLGEIDAGMRTLFSQMGDELEDGDESNRETFIEFADSVRDLSESARVGLGSLKGMIDSSRPVENMSKDMRKPLRRLRNSLTTMMEARDITDGWVEEADRLGLG